MVKLTHIFFLIVACSVIITLQQAPKAYLFIGRSAFASILAHKGNISFLESTGGMNCKTLLIYTSSNKNSILKVKNDPDKETRKLLPA